MLMYLARLWQMRSHPFVIGFGGSCAALVAAGLLWLAAIGVRTVREDHAQLWRDHLLLQLVVRSLQDGQAAAPPPRGGAK